MQKILSIFSAAVILAGAVGYYLAFNWAEGNIKQEMGRTVAETSSLQEYVTLSFAPDELATQVHFIESNQKEFIYQGVYYDVVKKEDAGGRIFFTCVADGQETSLFSFFSKHLVEPFSGNHASGKTTITHITPDWFFSRSLHFIYQPHAVSLCYYHLTCHTQEQPDFPAPPPRV